MTKAQQLAEKLKQYINVEDGYNIEFVNDLAEAVEYLSQDEQEPVAWLITHHENQPVLTFNSSDYQSERFIKTPFYAHQPEPFPQPRKNIGGNPCGECHLQAGETCCICGAINKTKGQ